ncbi:MAG: peptidoglycan-N-acetylglucosamine deacetylase [Candidatus Atribacteria bacterium]|jgi:peptidoglycan/xylan/chitin deacetylase (PgdA/CDA1 family)|nr:peptidoglycan-N-acetylglucosamine deacetylase [Candidatus Atribacteria bacterium]MDI3530328.1 peptidoglycan-N-acetylglucosamine deacetylase [Candidatus Atribacteria bacterium]
MRLQFAFLGLIALWIIVFGSNRAFTFEFDGKTEVYGLNQVRVITRAQVKDKVVALTFDDAPAPALQEILEVLNKREVKATFFIIGAQAQRYPELLKEIVLQGHELGNHSFSHNFDDSQKLEAMVQDIKKCEQVIFDLTGRIPLYFRPPGGFLNDRVKEACGRTGYSILMWSLDTRDWALSDCKEQIMENLLAGLSPGDIILLHVVPQTASLLDEMIAALAEEGYRILPLSCLLSGAYGR